MRLLLVRHGQASAGAADYDVLSPLGERQSRRAGERLARERPGARLVCGPRRRHRDTARHLREAAATLGVAYPEPIVHDALDELPVRELMIACLPQLLADDPSLQPFVERGAIRTLPTALVLDVVMRGVRRWATGEVRAPHVESPEAFVARVTSALRAIAAEGPAVVVTSGGPIAVALLGAGAARLDDALASGLALANASITELAVDDSLRLVPGDPVGHLPPDEITQV